MVNIFSIENDWLKKAVFTHAFGLFLFISLFHLSRADPFPITSTSVAPVVVMS